MKKTGSTKSPLALLLQEQYTQLKDVVVDVPEEKLNSKIIPFSHSEVSVRDLVAYQIGWATLLINWYKTGVQGKMPHMPSEKFSTWDYSGLADHFYKTYHYSSIDKQLEHFHKVVAEIIECVEHEFETENLDKVGVWPWCTLQSGKQWSLHKWVTVNTTAPYKRATTLIKKII